MANEIKRPRGRPAGREFTHMARVPMKPETWERLQSVAGEQNKSAAQVVRELIDRYLKRQK